MFLIAVVIWRRVHPRPRPPRDSTFVAVGAASGLGSALLGSVGPLTAPFFLARGLRRAAYIGTEAACALVMHLTKTAAYGATHLLDTPVLLLGLVLTPATLAGAWTGKKITNRIVVVNQQPCHGGRGYGLKRSPQDSMPSANPPLAGFYPAEPESVWLLRCTRAQRPCRRQGCAGDSVPALPAEPTAAEVGCEGYCKSGGRVNGCGEARREVVVTTNEPARPMERRQS